MKRVSNLLIAIIAVISLALLVSAFSLNTIPSQTHVQNTTNDKVIVLSDYASSDTTDYFKSCNSTELVTAFTGSGYNTNLTFHPALGFVGTTSCTVTATNTTHNLSKSFDVVVAAHNSDVTITAPAALTWIKTLSSTEKSSFTITNAGNTELSVELSLSSFADTANSSNTLSVGILNETEFTLAVGASKTAELSVAGIAASAANAVYSSNISVTYNSSSQQKTEIVAQSLTVRDAVASLSTVSSLRFGAEKSSLGANATSNFTITNNGDIEITGIQVSSNTESKYKVEFSLNGINFTDSVTIASLKKNEIANLSIRGIIPADSAAGTKTDIGDISINSPSLTGNMTISDFYIEPVSKLRIIQVDVDYTDITNNKRGGKLEENDEGNSINDLQPGTEMRISVKLENDFTDEENAQMEDIELTVTVVDIDDGSDLEDEESGIDINEESSQRVDFNFIIPKYAEKEEYEVRVEASGTDDKFKAKHKDRFTFTIEVDRKPFEVEITKIELRNPVLTCTRNTILNLEVSNLGAKELDDVKVEVANAELGINYVKEQIEVSNDHVDEDSRAQISIPIAISQSTALKSYTIRSKAYFSRTALDDVKDVQLTVAACGPVQQEDKKEEAKNETQTKQEDKSSQAADSDEKEQAKATQGQEPIFLDEEFREFRESNSYFTLLLVGFSVLLGIAAAMIAVLVMPKD